MNPSPLTPPKRKARFSFVALPARLAPGARLRFARQSHHLLSPFSDHGWQIGIRNSRKPPSHPAPAPPGPVETRADIARGRPAFCEAAIASRSVKRRLRPQPRHSSGSASAFEADIPLRALVGWNGWFCEVRFRPEPPGYRSFGSRPGLANSSRFGSASSRPTKPSL